MIEPAGRQVLSGVVIEQSPVCFKLIYQEVVQRSLTWRQAGNRADCQSSLERASASLRRQTSDCAIGVIEARHGRVSRIIEECGDDRLLRESRVTLQKGCRCCRRRPREDETIREQGDCVL